ncbi:hypothetical protein HMPREF1546_00640 [Oscillibacter sp. KLE 1745]|nr:hypothetical protein HMPREF1546_00640 [Oscillibacter sp. KLE 1745]
MCVPNAENQLLSEKNSGKIRLQYVVCGRRQYGTYGEMLILCFAEAP